MPKPVPLDPELRRTIRDEIAMRMWGRNEIARRNGVSPGVVSKIARENYLYFDDMNTIKATEAHRIDAEIARLERENEILEAMMRHEPTFRYRDGEETRSSRKESHRLDRALHELKRHHK